MYVIFAVFMLMQICLEDIAASSEGENWCNYLSSNPEPRVLLYNRIPKCGSSTIQTLTHHMSIVERKDRKKIATWSAPQEYWENFDAASFAATRKKFVNTIKSKHSAKKVLIVDGHWLQTQFTAGELGTKSFEYFQLARECRSQQHSFFYYGLFDSVGALHAKSRGRSYFRDYEMEFLKSKLKPSVCATQYSCLNHTNKFDNEGRMNKYLCGSKCVEEYKSPSLGANSNIRNPETFTVIGILEFLPEFLEMLECAYPSLRGIYGLYTRHNTTSNEGSHPEAYPLAMRQILNDTCDPKKNPYVKSYSTISELFWNRYNYMTKNRASCCRTFDR